MNEMLRSSCTQTVDSIINGSSESRPNTAPEPKKFNNSPIPHSHSFNIPDSDPIIANLNNIRTLFSVVFGSDTCFYSNEFLLKNWKYEYCLEVIEYFRYEDYRLQLILIDLRIIVSNPSASLEELQALHFKETPFPPHTQIENYKSIFPPVTLTEKEREIMHHWLTRAKLNSLKGDSGYSISVKECYITANTIWRGYQAFNQLFSQCMSTLLQLTEGNILSISNTDYFRYIMNSYNTSDIHDCVLKSIAFLKVCSEQTTATYSHYHCSVQSPMDAEIKRKVIKLGNVPKSPSTPTAKIEQGDMDSASFNYQSFNNYDDLANSIRQFNQSSSIIIPCAENNKALEVSPKSEDSKNLSGLLTPITETSSINESPLSLESPLLDYPILRDNIPTQEVINLASSIIQCGPDTPESSMLCRENRSSSIILPNDMNELSPELDKSMNYNKSPIIGELYVAIADYKSSDPSELSFSVNDLVTITQKDTSGWWKGICKHVTGWLPSNYVEPVYSDDLEE